MYGGAAINGTKRRRFKSPGDFKNFSNEVQQQFLNI
jgi:hypothetical protein